MNLVTAVSQGFAEFRSNYTAAAESRVTNYSDLHYVILLIGDETITSGLVRGQYARDSFTGASLNSISEINVKAL
jgi:hypothetical protein